MQPGELLHPSQIVGVDKGKILYEIGEIDRDIAALLEKQRWLSGFDETYLRCKVVRKHALSMVLEDSFPILPLLDEAYDEGSRELYAYYDDDDRDAVVERSKKLFLNKPIKYSENG